MLLHDSALVKVLSTWLAPVPAAIVQEIIDVAVIANALRAVRPAQGRTRRRLPATIGRDLQRRHLLLLRSLDRLRSIADALDDATPESAVALIEEAELYRRRSFVRSGSHCPRSHPCGGILPLSRAAEIGRAHTLKWW
jgi:hypothetical protein